MVFNFVIFCDLKRLFCYLLQLIASIYHAFYHMAYCGTCLTSKVQSSWWISVIYDKSCARFTTQNYLSTKVGHCCVCEYMKVCDYFKCPSWPYGALLLLVMTLQWTVIAWFQFEVTNSDRTMKFPAKGNLSLTYVKLLHCQMFFVMQTGWFFYCIIQTWTYAM